MMGINVYGTYSHIIRAKPHRYEVFVNLVEIFVNLFIAETIPKEIVRTYITDLSYFGMFQTFNIIILTFGQMSTINYHDSETFGTPSYIARIFYIPFMFGFYLHTTGYISSFIIYSVLLLYTVGMNVIMTANPTLYGTGPEPDTKIIDTIYGTHRLKGIGEVMGLVEPFTDPNEIDCNKYYVFHFGFASMFESFVATFLTMTYTYEKKGETGYMWITGKMPFTNIRFLPETEYIKQYDETISNTVMFIDSKKQTNIKYTYKIKGQDDSYFQIYEKDGKPWVYLILLPKMYK